MSEHHTHHHEAHNHDHHHHGDFKSLFIKSLPLGIIIMILSPMMGIKLPLQFTFSYSDILVGALSTILLIYGGKPFYQGALDEFRDTSEGSRVLFQVPQKKYNLDAYSIMPQAILKQSQKALTQNLIVIAIVMSVIISIVAIYITRGLARPLEQLNKTIVQIRSGHTNQRVAYIKEDEIGQLGKEFNVMLDEIEQLISHEYKAKLMLNKAEYKALQAQINPHFLYNTLDTMSSIASIQNCQMVSDLCQSLSNIFRYSLDMKHPYSTVAKEIDIVNPLVTARSSRQLIIIIN